MFKKQWFEKVGASGIQRCLGERLVYLPGALVLAYGFWLTLTT